MKWSLYRWAWLLESPLYIGMPPAGSLNRCRLYVPARTVWGAVTAEIARAEAGSNFPDYQGVGGQIRECVRFTYLFPADQDGEQWHAWLPRYQRETGLVWERETDSAKLPDRNFRLRLLWTRPSTAIEPSSDTAAEGSLRETECLNTRWRDHGRPPRGPVGLVGYVFLRSDLDAKFRELQMITVGGDTRYGLGRLRRVGDFSGADKVFGCKAELAQSDPELEAERALAHAVTRLPLRGDLELLRGWDYGKSNYWRTEKPLWVPGSSDKEPRKWRIEASGHWSLAAMDGESEG